ncbi:hypothetical protein ACRS5A_18730 [Acinetobacter baumannii]|uniref:hypothetical protein n=1 Tax=Acinetobacter baumannii TaxID=470 RepID=UPI0030C08A15
MATAAERQKERHNRKLKQGFKKRAFYVNQETLEKLSQYKEMQGLESLDEALNQIIKALSV